MDMQEFRDSVASSQPPKDLNFALTGLWWDAKGDWTRAQHSKTRARPVPGYTCTYTVRKAIRRTLRIGTSVRASRRSAVRFKRNGFQLQKLSSASRSCKPR